MNIKNISEYQKALEIEEKRLREELSALARKNPTNPDDFEATYADQETDFGADESKMEADPIDAADLIEEYEERNAETETLEDQYDAVKKALERIKNGTYGLCREGEPHPIEPERLRANPSATTCIKHQ